jgi:hypothetical protein
VATAQTFKRIVAVAKHDFILHISIVVKKMLQMPGNSLLCTLSFQQAQTLTVYLYKVMLNGPIQY